MTQSHSWKNGHDCINTGGGDSTLCRFHSHYKFSYGFCRVSGSAGRRAVVSPSWLFFITTATDAARSNEFLRVGR